MQSLKKHELEVLDLLISGDISETIIKEIKNEPHVIDYTVTGYGYFLTVKHPSLPSNRSVYNKPMLIGQSGNVETSFIIFAENGELTIECHGWGDIVVPQDYREMDIKIRKA
jgi:hypothetical protein